VRLGAAGVDELFALLNWNELPLIAALFKTQFQYAEGVVYVFLGVFDGLSIV
jgi:hypothetical protein